MKDIEKPLKKLKRAFGKLDSESNSYRSNAKGALQDFENLASERESSAEGLIRESKELESKISDTEEGVGSGQEKLEGEFGSLQADKSRTLGSVDEAGRALFEGMQRTADSRQTILGRLQDTIQDYADTKEDGQEARAEALSQKEKASAGLQPVVGEIHEQLDSTLTQTNKILGISARQAAEQARRRAIHLNDSGCRALYYGRFQEAALLFREAIQVHDGAESKFNLALALCLEGKMEEGLEIVDESVSMELPSELFSHLRALAALREGNPEKVVEAASESLEDTPEDRLANLLVSTGYLAAGAAHDALSHLASSLGTRRAAEGDVAGLRPILDAYRGEASGQILETPTQG